MLLERDLRYCARWKWCWAAGGLPVCGLVRSWTPACCLSETIKVSVLFFNHNTTWLAESLISNLNPLIRNRCIPLLMWTAFIFHAISCWVSVYLLYFYFLFLFFAKKYHIKTQPGRFWAMLCIRGLIVSINVVSELKGLKRSEVSVLPELLCWEWMHIPLIIHSPIERIS